jgi:hypothetical protein
MTAGEVLADVPGELPGDAYRIRASELNAEAHQESNTERRSELEKLAMAYLRLADQAERNAQNNVVYETPPPRASVGQQQQQQQQQRQQQQASSDDDSEPRS